MTAFRDKQSLTCKKLSPHTSSLSLRVVLLKSDVFRPSWCKQCVVPGTWVFFVVNHATTHREHEWLCYVWWAERSVQSVTGSVVLYYFLMGRESSEKTIRRTGIIHHSHPVNCQEENCILKSSLPVERDDWRFYYAINGPVNKFYRHVPVVTHTLWAKGLASASETSERLKSLRTDWSRSSDHAPLSPFTCESNPMKAQLYNVMHMIDLVICWKNCLSFSF